MAFFTKQSNTTVTSDPVTIEIKNDDYQVTADNINLNNTTIDSSGNINAAGHLYLPSLTTSKIPSNTTYKLYTDDIGDLIWQDKNVLIEDDDVTVNSLNVLSLNVSVGGIDYIWPQNDGTGVQVLTTDGNGLLTWTDKNAATTLDGLNDTTITSLAANNILKAELVSGSLKWVNSTSMSGLTINNSVIGGTTPAAGTFTTMTSSSGSVSGALTVGTDLTVSNDATVTGDLTVGSAVTLQDTLAVTGAITVNSAFTLPTSDGSNGQVLKTDGSGNVTWQTDSGVTISNDGNNRLITSDGSNGLVGESNLEFDGSDITLYEGVNDGNPSISVGASSTETLVIQSVYDSGAQTLDKVTFTTKAASATADKGSMEFYVDEALVATFDDEAINLATGKRYEINGTSVLSNNTLGSGVTASSLTSVGTLTSLITSGSITVGSDGSGSDVTFYSATAGDSFLWDASEEKLVITGTNGQNALEIPDGNVSITDNATIGGTLGVTGAVTINSAFTFPTTDGSSGQVLQTDGAGNVTWESSSSGITMANGVDNRITTASSSSAINGEANLTFDGTTLAVTGATTISSTVTVGTDGSGADVTFYSATAGDSFLWDASEEKLVITGTNGQNALEIPDGNVSITDNATIGGTLGVTGAVTVGSDGSGSDVTFYSATAGDSFLWDASEEKLVITGTNGQNALEIPDGNVSITDNATIGGTLGVTGAVTINSAFTFPTSDGSNGQTLQTDGGGNITWVTPASGITMANGADNRIVTASSSSALNGEANLEFDGSDLTLEEAVNDGNPSVSIGSGTAETLVIQSVYDSGAQTLDKVTFTTKAASGTGDKGAMEFYVDEALIVTFDDAAVNLASGKTYEINGTSVLSNNTLGSGVTSSSLTSVGTLTSLTLSGDLSLGDSDNLNIGAGDDLVIVHDGSNTSMTNSTGNLTVTNSGGEIIVDNTNTSGSTIMRLGTDTSATDFQIQNNSGSALLTVDGAGTVTVADGTNDFNVASHDGTNGLQLAGTLVTATAAELNIMDGVTANTSELNILDGVTATASELNQIAGITDGTATANKALIVDANNDINLGSGDLTATNITGTLQTASQGNITSVGTLTSLILSGDLSLGDSDNLNIGAGNDLVIVHDGSNTSMTNSTGNLTVTNSGGDIIIDNTNGTKSTIMRLGTDTSATDFQVQNNSGSALLTVDGAGTVTVADGTNDFNVASHDGTNGLQLAGTLVTATAAELNILDGVTATASELNQIAGITDGTATANKALIVDSNNDINLGSGDLTATNITGTLQTASQTNITSVGTLSSLTLAGNITLAEATNDGNPSVSIGSGTTETLIIQSVYDSGAQTLDKVTFTTKAASLTGDKGAMEFYVDEVLIATIDDEAVNLASGKEYEINGTSVLSSNALGGGVTSSSLTTVGTISSGTWNGTTIDPAYGGTGQDFSLSSGVITVSSGTFSASSTLGPVNGGTGQDFSISSGAVSVSAGTFSVGTLSVINGGTGAGTFSNNAILIGNGTNAIQAASNLSYDGSTLAVTGAATISTTLNVSGVTTLTEQTFIDIASKNFTPSTNGSILHIDDLVFTDNVTGSGSAAAFCAVKIEQPSLGASNPAITTPTATTLYIANAPQIDGTNMTITNPYALWVDNGETRLDGTLTLNNVKYTFPGSIGTVGQVLGIGSVGTPNTLTWTNSVSLANGSDNRIVTASGSSSLNGEANLSFNGTLLSVAGTGSFSGSLSVGSVTTLNERLIINITPPEITPSADGWLLHMDGITFTDANTAESGTATQFYGVKVEAPTLAATNASVTTTNAATMYIANAPTASTNMTITNPYALWVDAGETRLDGTVTLNGIKYTFPGIAGTAGQVLGIGTTGTPNILAWQSTNAVSLGSSTPNEIVTVTGSGSITGNSGLTYNGTLFTVTSTTSMTGSLSVGSAFNVTGTSTVGGIATFNEKVIIDIADKNYTPSATQGWLMHIDELTFTDVLSGSGTIADFYGVKIEQPTLAGSNSLTVTNAATVHIQNAPVEGSKTTITNAYALWVDAGTSKFDGDIDLTTGAIDIDLVDNNSSALSFDAAGKTGILEIVTTNSSEGVKMSGDLSLADSSNLYIGTGSDLTIIHDGSNTSMTNSTGNLTFTNSGGEIIVDNTNATGSTIMRLGTDTSATDFQIQNNSETSLFRVDGAGAATFSSTVSLNGVTYSFPINAGTASGQVLATDGSGGLSWVSNGGGLTLGGSNGVGNIVTATNGSTLNGESGLTFFGSTLAVTGAATISSTLSVGSDGFGADVTFYSGTAGDSFLWDASEEKLVITGTDGQDALQVPDGNVNFTDNLTVGGTFTLDTTDKNFSPTTDGLVIHSDAVTFTDNVTLASGTASQNFNGVRLEIPTVQAANASVTTTNATTLYVQGAPTNGTKMTITNAYALWVDAGTSKFDGDIDLTTGAIDIDLVDNNSSALSFDAAGKTGILEIVTTNSSEGVAMSGNLSLADSSNLYIGTGSDLTIIHDGSNTSMTNSTGNLTFSNSGGEIIVDNTNTSGSTIMRLGTDTSATDFQVQNNSASDLFAVNGAGTITLNGVDYTFPGSIGSAGQVLGINTVASPNVLDWVANGGISLANGVNNRIVTATGSSGLNGESNLTFDGTTLAVTGATTISSTLTIGSDGSGADVTFYSATAGDSFLWDASEEKLVITGTNGQNALEVPDGNVSITDSATIGGNLSLADNSNLYVGTGSDLTIVHNATNTIATSQTGDLIVDNTNVTGSTIMRLGTDTSATDFQIQNNSETSLFTVNGSGTITLNGVDYTFPGVVGSSGQVLSLSTVAPNTLAWVANGGGSGSSVSLTGSSVNTLVTVSGLNSLTSQSTLTFATGVTDTLTVGADGTGADVRFNSATASDYLFWDSANVKLVITGTDSQNALEVPDGDVNFTDNLTVGGTLDVTGETTLSGGLIKSRSAVSSSPYTVLISDIIIGVNNAAATTLNLPAAATAGAGKVYHIKDESGAASTYNITIDGNSSETIDGSTTAVISNNYGAVSIYCDGSNWFIF